nr:MAG TPA: hypothetical protein [Caudoviricetes sp.]
MVLPHKGIIVEPISIRDVDAKHPLLCLLRI